MLGRANLDASKQNMAPVRQSDHVGTSKTSATGEALLSVWGQLIIFFPTFIFYAYFVMLLKGMGESFILSKDEPLNPNIDEVMAL